MTEPPLPPLPPPDRTVIFEEPDSNAAPLAFAIILIGTIVLFAGAISWLFFS